RVASPSSTRAGGYRSTRTGRVSVCRSSPSRSGPTGAIITGAGPGMRSATRGHIGLSRRTRDPLNGLMPDVRRSRTAVLPCPTDASLRRVAPSLEAKSVDTAHGPEDSLTPGLPCRCMNSTPRVEAARSHGMLPSLEALPRLEAALRLQVTPSREPHSTGTQLRPVAARGPRSTSPGRGPRTTRPHEPAQDPGKGVDS